MTMICLELYFAHVKAIGLETFAKSNAVELYHNELLATYLTNRHQLCFTVQDLEGYFGVT